jgi:hypothetical protein
MRKAGVYIHDDASKRPRRVAGRRGPHPLVDPRDAAKPAVAKPEVAKPEVAKTGPRDGAASK